MMAANRKLRFNNIRLHSEAGPMKKGRFTALNLG